MNPKQYLLLHLPLQPKTSLQVSTATNAPILIHRTLLKTQIRCAADTGSGSRNWEKWLPKNVFSADKVLRLIAGATSSPICQFISSPTTFLHTVDPRIKLAWLLALVLLPARSNILMRFGLVIYLAVLSVWVLPKEVWMMAHHPSSSKKPTTCTDWIAEYSGIFRRLFICDHEVRTITAYKKGLVCSSTSACLTFTVFQSASLCLTTTTSEQLAYALQWFMLPLTKIGVPVAEAILTLLLSLRFINLVFDEVRNVALGIVSRRINWQQLTFMETLMVSTHFEFSNISGGIFAVFFMYIRRIFKNIFSHAEQISQAMIVRGFRGDSNAHKIYFSSDSSIGMPNILSLLCLVGLIGATAVSYALYRFSPHRLTTDQVLKLTDVYIFIKKRDYIEHEAPATTWFRERLGVLELLQTESYFRNSNRDHQVTALSLAELL
ncbi:hypothetical protein C3L33_14957, partial [Rhododendron williamsianum]